MSYAALKKTAQRLNEQASFVVEITTTEEYERALALLNEVIEDSDDNPVLIELLSGSIYRWETRSSDFSAFNRSVKKGDPAVAVLRVLMDQHQLGVADLPEIGSESLVSDILNGRDRQLTRGHITALSQRFGISPALFFDA